MIKKKNKYYKEALLDMVQQFAFQVKKNGLPAYGTGGLSALEIAFEVLNWDDPHSCPENKCALCNEWATCGTPSSDGYKRVCCEHFRLINEKGWERLKMDSKKR